MNQLAFLLVLRRGHVPLIDLFVSQLQFYLTQLIPQPIFLVLELFHLYVNLYQTLISYFQMLNNPYLFPFLFLIFTIHLFCISVHQLKRRISNLAKCSDFNSRRISNLADISNLHSPITIFYSWPIVLRFRSLGIRFHLLIFLMPPSQLLDAPLGLFPQN